MRIAAIIILGSMLLGCRPNGTVTEQDQSPSLITNTVIIETSEGPSLQESIKLGSTKILLAWYATTEREGEVALCERIISTSLDKRHVLTWLNKNAGLLNSIPEPTEEPGATRPWWEMSIYKGDDPWDQEAQRISIYNKTSLADPAFREIEVFFKDKGRKRRDAE